MSFSLLADDSVITWDDGEVTGVPVSAVTDARAALADREVAAVTPTGPWFERSTPEHAWLVLRERQPDAEVGGDPPSFGSLGDELQEAGFEPHLHPRDRRGRFIDFLGQMPHNSIERMASYNIERTREGHYLIRKDSDPRNPVTHATPEAAFEHIERIEGAPEAGVLNAQTFPRIFDGFEHNGMRAEVTQTWGGGCSGVIRDTETGNSVGNFAREIDVARDGVHIYHDALSIKPAFQGRGFGTAFFEDSLAKYKERGVVSLRVTAGSSVGGYQWARRGFDFNLDRYKVLGTSVWLGVQPQRENMGGDDRFARAFAVHEMYERRFGIGAFSENKVLGEVPDALWAEFESKFPTREKLVAYIEGDDHALDGTFTSPQEIATFGREHRWVEAADRVSMGREMWLGKRFLVGAAWRGEMDLRR